MTRVLRAIAAGILLWAAPATAQAPGPKPIDVAADAPWLHANSGMTFPLTLAGFSRTMVREYEAPQLDVIGTWTRGDEEELSVYVYRSTAGSVPVWFDRATWAIESRGLYGQTTPAQVPAAFRAPGAAVDSGLIASWTTEGRYKGTGVAILPLGDWLVKLRFSSTSRDGAGAAAVLREAVAGLGWPATIPAAPIAAPVPTCATPIGFKGEAKSARWFGGNPERRVRTNPVGARQRREPGRCLVPGCDDLADRRRLPARRIDRQLPARAVRRGSRHLGSAQPGRTSWWQEEPELGCRPRSARPHAQLPAAGPLA
jgi:hypothetical protein